MFRKVRASHNPTTTRIRPTTRPVMATHGLQTWVEITGLVVGLVLVVVGLWLARTFRNKDPNRPHRPDEE